MNKKLIGIGIGIIIAVAIVVAISSYKIPPESNNQSNTILPNATQKPQVIGRHITVELNESMSLSTR